MDRRIVITVTEREAGLSYGDILRGRGFSRHLLAQMKKMTDGCQDDACSQGKRPAPGTLFSAGDSFPVYVPETECSGHIVPTPMTLAIVYEDEDILVVNKPAGLPVHPSTGNYANTLANGLMAYYRREGSPFVFRCINRLDRDTSGLLLVAKNPLSGCILSAQMKERAIRREYVAVVKGVLPPQGYIDAPIARAPGSILERRVDYLCGETARTRYVRLAYTADLRYSLARLCLDTGRTHQIRVHMSYIGHPLPGDFLYCPDFTDYQRQPLHSAKLSFPHPLNGQVLTFTAPAPFSLP